MTSLCPPSSPCFSIYVLLPLPLCAAVHIHIVYTRKSLHFARWTYCAKCISSSISIHDEYTYIFESVSHSLTRSLSFEVYRSICLTAARAMLGWISNVHGTDRRHVLNVESALVSPRGQFLSSFRAVTVLLTHRSYKGNRRPRDIDVSSSAIRLPGIATNNTAPKTFVRKHVELSQQNESTIDRNT